MPKVLHDRMGATLDLETAGREMSLLLPDPLTAAGETQDGDGLPPAGKVPSGVFVCAWMF